MRGAPSREVSHDRIIEDSYETRVMVTLLTLCFGRPPEGWAWRGG